MCGNKFLQQRSLLLLYQTEQGRDLCLLHVMHEAAVGLCVCAVCVLDSISSMHGSMYIQYVYVDLNVADPFPPASCTQNKQQQGAEKQPKLMFSAGETSVNNENRLLFVLPVETRPGECDNIYTSP